MTSHTWAPDWESRITAAARSLGFANLTELLASMPSRPYDEVANLFENVAPIQLVDVQFMEARTGGWVREAARDSLCRHLVEELPEGWGIGEKSDWHAVLALSSWSSGITATGECDYLEPILIAISRAIRQLPPPQGWLPQGPDDPLIESVFNSNWPAV